jgi:23S rRNA (adenine2503-C2)-methyltransferase
LIADVNDRSWQAEALAKLLRGTDIHVNVIPLNPTPGFGVPASQRVKAFAEEARQAGANVTIRDTRGRDIDAACGQLATTIATKKKRPGVSARRAGAAGA